MASLAKGKVGGAAAFILKRNARPFSDLFYVAASRPAKSPHCVFSAADDRGQFDQRFAALCFVVDLRDFEQTSAFLKKCVQFRVCGDVPAENWFSDPAATALRYKKGNTMRTSHIITAAIFSTFAMSASPAFADRFNDPETVVFELDLTASETAIYDTISEQARRACADDRRESSVLSRAGTTRKCQKRLIANVVEALNVPIVTVLAKADGVKLNDG